MPPAPDDWALALIASAVGVVNRPAALIEMLPPFPEPSSKVRLRKLDVGALLKVTKLLMGSIAVMVVEAGMPLPVTAWPTTRPDKLLIPESTVLPVVPLAMNVCPALPLAFKSTLARLMPPPALVKLIVPPLPLV